MKKLRGKEKGITLIALIVTIVVLIILAAVTISMLTGENGIITQAQKSKEQNEIGKEKEYINLAFSAVKAGKIARGDMSDVTSAELQQEINNYTKDATVTGTGTLKITYTSGRKYEVDGNGKIVSSESYNGMYSVGDLEGKIAPQDLFEYEIIDEQAKTARIVRIKPEYFNYDGFNIHTGYDDLTTTNGYIIYNGEKISDMLVIPYEMEQNGVKYTITEANIMAEKLEPTACIPMMCLSGVYPNVDNVIYPNSITAINTPFPYGEYIEFNAEGLKSIVLSDNLKEIPEKAFYNGINLTSITIPNSVTSIGEDAFYGNAWYNNLPDGDVYIGRVYYEYKGEMPADTSITIKEGTTCITGNAFYRCSNLTNITIPNSVTSIGDYAFYCCTNLTNITIPDSVTSIGGYAFSGTAWNENLWNNLPDGDVYIGRVYYGYKGEMPADTSITIKEGTTHIVQSAFSYLSNLTNITIPNSVTSIGDRAFECCSNLTNITIPNSVTSIGVQIFRGCRNLTSVTIPNNLRSIGSWAFCDCISLTTITIPSSVTRIACQAFIGCNNLLVIIQQEEGNLTYAPWGAGNVIYTNLDNILSYSDFTEDFLNDKNQDELEELILKSVGYLGTFEQYLSDNGMSKADLEQIASQENMTYIEYLRYDLKTNKQYWLNVEYFVYLQGGQDKTVEELRELKVNKWGYESFEQFLEEEGMTIEDWQTVVSDQGFRTEKDYWKYQVYFNN